MAQFGKQTKRNQQNKQMKQAFFKAGKSSKTVKCK